MHTVYTDLTDLISSKACTSRQFMAYVVRKVLNLQGKKYHEAGHALIAAAYSDASKEADRNAQKHFNKNLEAFGLADKDLRAQSVGADMQAVAALDAVFGEAVMQDCRSYLQTETPHTVFLYVDKATRAHPLGRFLAKIYQLVLQAKAMKNDATTTGFAWGRLSDAILDNASAIGKHPVADEADHRDRSIVAAVQFVNLAFAYQQMHDHAQCPQARHLIKMLEASFASILLHPTLQGLENLLSALCQLTDVSLADAIAPAIIDWLCVIGFTTDHFIAASEQDATHIGARFEWFAGHLTAHLAQRAS